MTRPLLAKRYILTLFGFCVLSFALASSSIAQEPNKTEFLKKARQTYYSLKSEGLAEFQCSMTPNWEFLLQDQRKADPTSIDAAIQKLQALHFGLTLGLDGNAKVTHNELPAENEQVASGLKQVYSGMEQMASGFFQTWSAYMISPALPDPGVDFQLELVGSGYRVTYKDGTADVVTTLGQDFVMTDQRIKTSEFDTTIKPQFKKGPKGFILAGYQASYRGATAAEATELNVAIDYQEVNGLQFPQEILLSGSYGATPFKAKVAFTGCQATKH
ncbi:MAG: hypothetical protein WBR10_06170 [Candidatus Acidiferrum sp.]